jgi:glycosyltransferase involved in cell wall biosynthesis
LFLGRFDPVKAPLRLVSALEHLPPSWHAVFHGHGPQRQELLAAAALAGDRCHVLPPLTHDGDALAAADVLAMPSQFEGMPLALVEAWLAGLPAVTTPLGFVQEAERRHGPLAEIVPHEPTGEELARGILRAAQRTLVEAAQRIAWQIYTAAAMAQRWEEYLIAAIDAWRLSTLKLYRFLVPDSIYPISLLP